MVMNVMIPIGHPRRYLPIIKYALRGTVGSFFDFNAVVPRPASIVLL